MTSRSVQPLVNSPNIRIGSTCGPIASAVPDLWTKIGHDQTELGLVFVDNSYDRDALAHALHQSFGAVPVIGCTSAGEIGPLGYALESISGVTFGTDDLTFEIGLLENASTISIAEGQSFAYALRQKLSQRIGHFDPYHCFALLLIDGLCCHEEIVARAIFDGLGGISMIGGSAGDGLNFTQTAVLFNGRFHTNAALLLVAHTRHPFTTFKTQHFESSQQRLVLTQAIPEQRIACEINGRPAAQEYARVIGLDIQQLSPLVFSSHPMVVKIGGAEFVRSIQKVNPDGSMRFYCAIDEGIVFNVAKGVNLVDNLNTLFDDIERRIGPPHLILGCDCILRRLELSQTNRLDQVSRILHDHNVVGFSTYGEQFQGIHVNQTFTGIAFGARGNT